MIDQNQLKGNSEVLRPTIRSRHPCNVFLIRFRITVSKPDTSVQDMMKLELIKMIPLGKSLEMSDSLHFAYIISYIHTFICSVSISMDISKMNKFIENLAKLFNKATSLSCHKKNNAIVPDNPNSREHLSQFGS